MPYIDLKITLDSPLHIGGGNTTPGAPQPIVRDARGRPCIPATTLKGLHRAATEGIAVALELPICNVPSPTCQPLNGQAACVVCRIFGSPWLPGIVRYRDLIATATSAVQTETRVTTPQSRRRRVQLDRVTISREVLPAGLTLNGRIELLTQDRALIALALAGLRSVFAWGASKATGSGRCTVEASAFESARKPGDVGEAIADSELAAALRQFQKLQNQSGQQRQTNQGNPP
jgi:CRISPR/Cas system CSM-associated protein Csm3 (group 7 of RAMP superfamily)